MGQMAWGGGCGSGCRASRSGALLCTRAAAYLSYFYKYPIDIEYLFLFLRPISGYAQRSLLSATCRRTSCVPNRTPAEIADPVLAKEEAEAAKARKSGRDPGSEGPARQPRPRQRRPARRPRPRRPRLPRSCSLRRRRRSNKPFVTYVKYGGCFLRTHSFFKNVPGLPHTSSYMSGHHLATVRRAGRKRGARFESNEALAEQPAVKRSAVELHRCCARVSRAAARPTTY